MKLARPDRRIAAISIVPLVDVLLILLVFFMVTSTYLDLDMIPVLDERGARPRVSADGGGTILVRVLPGGAIVAGGAEIQGEGVEAFLARRLAADPALRVLVFPAPRADVQALVSVMDAATHAGLETLQLVRLEAR